MMEQTVSSNIYQYNQSVAEEYYKDLIDQDLSPGTVTTYHKKLQKFLRYLNKPIDELTYEDVAQFLNSIKHLANSTRELHASVLTSFFTYCVGKGYMEKVLMKNRWRVKQKKLLPRPLDRPQRAELRIIAERLSDRDRAIIEFILSSGCRNNEVSMTNIIDFNFSNNTAIVMGKGRKPRKVRYSDTAALLLKRISHGRDPKSPMFINNRGQRLSNSGIHSIVFCASFQMDTVNHNIGPHILRHTFASHMLSNGADIFAVARSLGHAYVQTTNGYAKNLDDDLVVKFHKKMG